MLPIIGNMHGMTISEMAAKLGLPRDTVKRRILRKGFRPISQEAVYDEAVYDAIKDSRAARPRRQRPRSRKRRPRSLRNNP